MTKKDAPNRTIEGDQSWRARRKREAELPVRLEQLLYLAAKDEVVKADLLADREETLERLGIRLRPSEAKTLQSVSDAALKAMIERIRPNNPKRRGIMKMVAATAATLAAGTVVVSSGGCTESAGGVGPDVNVDGGEDGGENDTDTNTQ